MCLVAQYPLSPRVCVSCPWFLRSFSLGACARTGLLLERRIGGECHRIRFPMWLFGIKYQRL